MNSAQANMNLVDRWASLLGGIALAGSAVRGKSPNKLRLLLGSELIRRSLTGHCYAYQALGMRTQPVTGGSVSVPYELGVHARAAVTIAKPRDEVYRFWRDFRNLPAVMKHLEAVEVRSPQVSHWVAQGPGKKQISWDAEIHNDIENELIAWRSLPGSEVASAGSVHLKDAPGGRGTEVVVRLQYNPPAGLIGATVAKLFGRDAETEVESDLFRLKQYLEGGEIATAEGQPRGTSAAPCPPRPIESLRSGRGISAVPREEVRA